MTIKEMEVALEHRMAYAARIIEDAIKYTFVRHNMWFSCDFAGCLLAYVAECPRTSVFQSSDRRFLVCIRDADDYTWTMFFKTQEAAEKVFDKFFGEDNSGYTVELERELHNYGFY